MLPLTPAGFFAAPFIKTTLLLTSVSSLSSNVLFPRNSFNLLAQNLPGQWWRLLTQNVIWNSNGELLLGSLLLYHLRLFERLYGSGKFASFALVTTLLTTLMQLLVSALGNSVAPGPYGLIFATLVQYYRDVPPTFYFSILGIQISDKSFLYLLAIQLLVMNPPASVWSSVCGIIAGFIYASGLFPSLVRWRIPASIQSFFSQITSPLASDPLARPNVPNRSNHRPPQAVEFGEQQVQLLTSMGFERGRVVAALRSTGGDAAAAAELLLNQG